MTISTHQRGRDPTTSCATLNNTLIFVCIKYELYHRGLDTVHTNVFIVLGIIKAVFNLVVRFGNTCYGFGLIIRNSDMLRNVCLGFDLRCKECNNSQVEYALISTMLITVSMSKC